MSFGITSFAETAFSEVGTTTVTVIPGGSFSIFPLDADTMEFPLRINKLSSFNLDVNFIQEHLDFPLQINKLCAFSFNINKKQQHTVDINKETDFGLRR
jgi:hypothetical protein